MVAMKCQSVYQSKSPFVLKKITAYSLLIYVHDAGLQLNLNFIEYKLTGLAVCEISLFLLEKYLPFVQS